MAVDKSVTLPRQLHDAPYLTSLLVSPDSGTIDDIRQATGQLAISVCECRAVLNFANELRHKKFEAVFVDFQLGEEQASNCVKLVRQSASNRTVMVFAVTADDSESSLAFTVGSNYVLQRPMTENSILGVLKIAYG